MRWHEHLEHSRNLANASMTSFLLGGYGCDSRSREHHCVTGRSVARVGLRASIFILLIFVSFGCAILGPANGNNQLDDVYGEHFIAYFSARDFDNIGTIFLDRGDGVFSFEKYIPDSLTPKEMKPVGGDVIPNRQRIMSSSKLGDLFYGVSKGSREKTARIALETVSAQRYRINESIDKYRRIVKGMNDLLKRQRSKERESLRLVREALAAKELHLIISVDAKQAFGMKLPADSLAKRLKAPPGSAATIQLSSRSDDSLTYDMKFEKPYIIAYKADELPDVIQPTKKEPGLYGNYEYEHEKPMPLQRIEVATSIGFAAPTMQYLKDGDFAPALKIDIGGYGDEYFREQSLGFTYALSAGIHFYNDPVVIVPGFIYNVTQYWPSKGFAEWLRVNKIGDEFEAKFYTYGGSLKIMTRETSDMPSIYADLLYGRYDLVTKLETKGETVKATKSGNFYGLGVGGVLSLSENIEANGELCIQFVDPRIVKPVLLLGIGAKFGQWLF